jgi:predicted ATP-grasp superfamily ATP-dependent carboligase
MNNVLVLDAQLRPSLAIIRSLGRKGINVSTASEHSLAMGSLSKYSHQRFLLPNPRKKTSEYLDSLIKILRNESFDCVFASRTYTAYLLSQHQKELSSYTRIPTPRLEVFEIAYQKEKTLQTAQQNDIFVPKIYTSGELRNGAVDYPVIIKSSRKHGLSIKICESPSELQSRLKKMTQKHGPCMVQEYIPNGGEIGVYALLNKNSQPRAAIVQRRIRTCFSYGGASTLRETIKNDDLLHRSLDFLKKLTWIGVAMMEFRIDKRNGRVYLLEINPRFWGSLELSIYAGIDFPYMLYRMLLDGDVEPVFNYQSGVRTRWLFGDVRQFILNFGTLDNAGFFSLQTHDDVISKDDMLPSIYGSLSILTRN